MATADSNRRSDVPHLSRGRIASYMFLGLALVLCFYVLRKPRRSMERPAPPATYDPAREIRMLGGRIDRSDPQWLEVTFGAANDSNLKHIQRLDRVSSLNLAGSRITDQGVALLVGMTDLEVLNLANTKVADEGLKYLRSLTNLRELRLSGTQITGPGLQHLEPLVNLSILFLDRTRIDNDALAHLAVFPQLKVLDLSGSPTVALEAERTTGRITDQGLQHLSESNALNVLDLKHNDVTAAGIADLQASLPNVRIHH